MMTAALIQVHHIAILKSIFVLIGSLIELAVITIEFMLFYLETFRYRFITIAFFVVEVLVLMFMNAHIPFSGLLVLTAFSIMKNVFRVMKVDEIYRTLGYYELCKRYGIKVKKPRKARTTAVKKAVTPVKKTKRSTAKEEPTFA